MTAQQAVELTITGDALDENGLEAVDMMPLNDSRGTKNVVELYFADPTVYAEGGKFYAAGTRGFGPAGFTLLESSDLRNWSYARPDSLILKKGRDCWGESGFWAPQIFKNGENDYLLAYVANERCCIAHSNSLTGDYTQSKIEPVDNSAGNIDPFIFKDDDGKYYMYHVRFSGGNILNVGELDPKTWKIKSGTLKECFRNTQSWEATNAYPSAPIMEGPTVVKLDGKYYLFYSANHYQSTDYAVGYAYSDSPTGPWTKYSGNPIIHRNIVGEMGSGHGDVFVDNDGNLCYVYHVHYSDTQANPRRTRIIKMKVEKGGGHPYKISVDPESIIYPSRNNGARDGLFSGYVRLKAGSYSLTGKDAEGNTVTYGLDSDGKLTAGGSPLECSKDGVYRVLADTKKGTVETTLVTEMMVRSMLLSANTSLPYVGNGVFAGEASLTREVPLQYQRKTLYFCINNNNNFNIKRIPGTKNVNVPGDGITGEDIRVNNGVYNVTLDMNRGTLDLSAEVDPCRITVLGSSIANGQGATSNNGYAYMLGEALKSSFEASETGQQYTVSNVSMNSNTTTGLLNRFDDVILDHGKFVIIDASLGDEGMHGNSAASLVVDNFSRNVQRLVEKVREAGKEPVVMNCGPRGDFSTTDYNYIKTQNKEINAWEVPSVNVLGTVDSGRGKWADAFAKDNNSPNDDGHKQIANAITPSLFEALAAGKKCPVRDKDGHELTLDENSTLTFTPEGDLNSFTLALRVKVQGAGEILHFATGADGSGTFRLSVNEAGKLVAEDAAGTQKTSTKAYFTDDAYHMLILTHQYALNRLIVYVDKSMACGVSNQALEPGTFTIGDKAEYHSEDGATQAKITVSELSFWRSSIHTQELAAIVNGDMLKSSLELYAPMAKPESGVSGENGNTLYEIENKAQSMNKVMLVVPDKNGVEGVGADAATAAEAVAFYTVDGRYVSDRAEGLPEGLYVVRYSDGSAKKLVL